MHTHASLRQACLLGDWTLKELILVLRDGIPMNPTDYSFGGYG